MRTDTFDLGTDGLTTDDPQVIEWMKARVDGSTTA